jgi:hypothetical protein
MENTRHDILSVYSLLNDFGICKSEHVYSVEWLGRSRTYFAYLNSSGNEPNVECLLYLMVKLTHVAGGLLTSRSKSTEIERKARTLRDAGDDILHRACEQALALSNCHVMRSNVTSADTLDSCASKRLGEGAVRRGRSSDHVGGGRSRMR